MRNNYLLPNKFKKVGLILFIAAVAAYCLCQALDWSLDVKVFALANDLFGEWEFCSIVENDIIDEITMSASLVGLCLIALSKEKDEDEMTGQIRMKSFVWTFWVTACILLFGIIFLYEMASLYFTYIALLLVFFLFIIKFNVTMHQVRRASK